MTSGGKTAAVIGAGIGGLALAIRLQSAGIDTVVLEARDQPGGRAQVWQRGGFTFDAGPSSISDPSALRALWALSGRDMAEDVTLLPVRPFYRLNWPDGTQFDFSDDEQVLQQEILRLDPRDLQGYQRFLDYAAKAKDGAYDRLAQERLTDFAAMARAVPMLVKTQAWRSAYGIAARFVENEKLRQALSFQTLFLGGNPMRASGLHALIHMVEKRTGLWFAKGGTGQLVAGMVRLFERLGGTLRLGDPVAEIETAGDRAIAVRTVAGERLTPTMIASNADIMHSYAHLLANSPRGRQAADALSRKAFSPGMFIVHFGVRGSWPGIPHNMVLFGPRYRGLWADIFDFGVLPHDLTLYLHHPTVTDPALAPEGQSVFTAMVPVPNIGCLPVDWHEIGPLLERRVLDEIGRRLIPDIDARIVTKFHYTPADSAADLGAYLGNAFSLEPLLKQSGWFRVHNRDDAIHNLYFVGAGTHPGAGIPGVVAGAGITAAMMLEDFRK